MQFYINVCSKKKKPKKNSIQTTITFTVVVVCRLCNVYCVCCTLNTNARKNYKIIVTLDFPWKNKSFGLAISFIINFISTFNCLNGAIIYLCICKIFILLESFECSIIISDIHPSTLKKIYWIYCDEFQICFVNMFGRIFLKTLIISFSHS